MQTHRPVVVGYCFPHGVTANVATTGIAAKRCLPVTCLCVPVDSLHFVLSGFRRRHRRRHQEEPRIMFYPEGRLVVDPQMSLLVAKKTTIAAVAGFVCGETRSFQRLVDRRDSCTDFHNQSGPNWSSTTNKRCVHNAAF